MLIRKIGPDINTTHNQDEEDPFSILFLSPFYGPSNVYITLVMTITNHKSNGLGMRE